MLAMLRDLVAHKGHANAAVLDAVRADAAAAADRELWDLLHHILLANRFWLQAILGAPFVLDEAARASTSFDELMARFAALQAEEQAWLESATDEDLARMLVNPQIPGGTCSVSQGFMQVCLHSHGHRAQCAKLLRRHGVVPPQTDFILWLAARPASG
jgi:uncharacterized damage-inducible protein DinB